MIKTVSVVVPMYFEEQVANECYKRLKDVLRSIVNYDHEIVFVNDGSQDKTMDILRDIANLDKKVKVLSFSRNFGHQVAVSCGIEHANGDAIVIIDADLQDPPELIPKMLELWEDGYEVVYGKRKKRKGETIFKKVTAKCFYKVLDHLAEVHIPRDTGDFRLIDRKVANQLSSLTEHNRFLRGLVAWIGFRQIALEYERDERFAGETKYPLKRMIRFALDGMISFSAKPLRLISSLGMISVIIAIVIMMYALTSFIFPSIHTVPGWTSLMITITFLSGVQLISVGVLGEYVARIYDESKNRPLYIIKEEININAEADLDIDNNIIHNKR